MEYIGHKVSMRLGMLRRGHSTGVVYSCVTLYNAMILPIFDYCTVIWDSCNKANQDYLDKLHRCAASIIKGHKVSQSQLLHIFSWPSLQSCRNYLSKMHTSF